MRFPDLILQNLVLQDVRGGRVKPLPVPGRQAAVFFFLTHDCPISNAYASELNRICAAYTPKNIAFFVVYTEADTPLTELRRHAAAFGYRCPALCDPDQKLIGLLDITVTPEVAVVSPKGELLYRGRIDNTYAAPGKRRLVTTEHELCDALEATLRGKPIAQPRTRAVGCYITRK